MTKILLTAFDPFGGESINPAQEASKSVSKKIGHAAIVKCFVPTSFSRSFDVVREAIDREEPDYVVMIGQAGGRTAITPERRAVNRIDARISDNDGFQPTGQRISPNGPDEYVTALPIERIVKALSDSDIPACISESAGTFVCNYLFFRVMDYLKNDNHTKAGFVHVPYETRQTKDKENVFSLPIDEIIRGLEIVLSVLANG